MAMPSVRNIQASSVQGRTQRAQAASMRPSIKRSNGEGKRDREPDIAEVEQRRVNGETRVLQDRIEIAPSNGGSENAQERVRRDQNEENECDRDPRLHGQHIGLETRRQISAEQRNQRTEQAEDQNPQQHRAFVVPQTPLIL